MDIYKGQDVPPGIVALHFGASWCGPCRQQRPIATEVFRRLGIKAFYVDVDVFPELARAHKVLGVPTCKLLRDGVELSESVGASSASDFEAWVQRHV